MGGCAFKILYEALTSVNLVNYTYQALDDGKFTCVIGPLTYFGYN